MKLVTLKRRAEFLAIRGGARWSCASFLIEAKRRPAGAGDVAATHAAAAVAGRAHSDDGPARANPRSTGSAAGIDPPRGSARFGFTVTKKLGGAVVRNRIRRRLREAVRIAQQGRAQPDFNYVIVARSAAATTQFAALVADLQRALTAVHTERTGHSGSRPHRAGAVPPSHPGRSGPSKG